MIKKGNKSKTNILRTRTHFDSFDGSSEKLDDDSYFNLIKDSDYYSETLQPMRMRIALLIQIWKNSIQVSI